MSFELSSNDLSYRRARCQTSGLHQRVAHATGSTSRAVLNLSFLYKFKLYFIFKLQWTAKIRTSLEIGQTWTSWGAIFVWKQFCPKAELWSVRSVFRQITKPRPVYIYYKKILWPPSYIKWWSVRKPNDRMNRTTEIQTRYVRTIEHSAFGIVGFRTFGFQHSTVS